MGNKMAGRSGGGRRGLPDGSDLENRLCLSVPEAARMLGISRNFAYQLVRDGQLPVAEFGKRKVIPKAALEKRLEQGVNNERAHQKARE
jgi:excisionase family DNA binding protein